MACNIYYENLFFCVQKISNFNIKEYYVFIGDIDINIKNILTKIEDRKDIKKEEVIILKNNYKDYYLDWIEITRKKYKIKFIENIIHIDDTISNIREKIFVYLSDEKTKSFILPQNQELFLEKKDGSMELIGYYYEDKDTHEKIFKEPHINNKGNLIELKKNLIKNIKKNTSENSMLIYDLLQSGNYNNKIIYLSDAKDEEKYLKSKNININEELINNYFSIFWPYLNLYYNENEIKNNYLLLKDYYTKENFIFNYINNIKNIKNNNIFGSCNILTIQLNINKDINDNNDTKEKYIDLFPIFDYLRENKISEKTPFIKYSENLLDTPFTVISRDAIVKKLIKKDKLKEWIGVNDDYRKMTGLLIKRLFKTSNNEPNYSSYILTKNGKINIRIGFLNENNANFNDIVDCIKDCKSLIEDINKNRVIKKKIEIDKIDTPDMSFENNKLYLKENTNIIFMNIIIPLKLDKPLDFKKLLEFSKKFPYFLSEVTNEDKNDELNSIKLKYKRISGFTNMNDILLEIDFLKEKYDKDIGFIIKALEKKYQKSIDEIKKYLIEWERKYSSSKSTKISSEFRKGIIVSINNNNILFKGITKVYQIPLIYNFFLGFITLFINYDNYLKNIEFKQFFSSKDLINSKYLKDYEIEKNTKLNINNIYYQNYNLDEGLYNNFINDIIKIEDDDKIIKNNTEVKYYNSISQDKIDPNIKLKCDDKIPELGTCKDFCNDQKYFLRRLQSFDNRLFKPNTDKKEKIKQYSRKCQESINRQPVVIGYDPSSDKRVNKDSFTYSIKYSSDEKDRWYICPKIWCPYCQIPIYEKDIDVKTIKVRTTKDEGGKCKTAICPFGNHQVFIREYEHKYPGFMNSSFHPNGLCMPCCFKNPQNDPKSIFYKSFKKCIGDDIENTENRKNGQIYILGKGIPIDKNRYGRLPLDIAKILKTNLETGPLGNKFGYLRKGIKHINYNSFLCTICDILSCDKKNLKIDLNKIKQILIEKLDENLFRSLYSGNLQNIFYNPLSKNTALDNFKKYILNNSIEISHKYLWDLLQRDNILFDNGINIFIFENNRMLCPKGENIDEFYNINKNSILIIKSKNYYEPIYFIRTVGKNIESKCIFNSTYEEIRKLFNIAYEGCKSKNEIDWLEILKNNIKKYDLNIDNLELTNGSTLEYTINELINSIKNKKLNNTFLPKLQYVDSYNKVFAILLNNNLYLPVQPSKLITNIKYIIIEDINDIEKLDINNTISFTKDIVKYTNLKCNITHKILDLKNKDKIIALVNEYNRFIPIKSIKDDDKKLKISNLNYFSDLDESLNNRIEKIDNRIIEISKKNFEDETYIRMKFELSKFLENKKNIEYYKNFIKICEGIDKDIKIRRVLMKDLLNEIYAKLIKINKKINNDYFDYKIPNKRFPCIIRDINKNSILSCDADPHCINDKGICKLMVNEKNLINNIKYSNYNYYLSKIIDEILRSELKRNEIINDEIETIINKNLFDKDTKKYIVLNSLNIDEINNEIDELYDENKDIYFDNRNLYENINTKEISFKKDKYLLKSDKELLQNNKYEELSVFWMKYLGDKFKIKIMNKSLYMIIVDILNLSELKDNKNNGNSLITLDLLKDSIVSYILKDKNIMNTYKKENNRIFKYLTNVQLFTNEILSSDYSGSDTDLEIISIIYGINIILLNKRIKTDKDEFKIFKSRKNKSDYKSNYFIIIYKSINENNNIYNIIQLKNKILFKLIDLPQKFIEKTID